MKKLIASLAICFMFVGIGSSFAEPVQLQKHTWELGTEISHITYEEPGVMMEEKGIMYGIVGSYAYHDNLMFKAEGKFSFGWVDYSSPSGTADYIQDYMLEFRGLGGYDFPVSTATILTPYIGLGYRYLNDDLSSIGGYERESKYYYSPIGIETITKLDNEWSLGAILEYDHFWGGTQISHLSDVNSCWNDLKNDQNDGYGWRGSVKFQKDTLVIEPFIRYWDIERSDSATITCFGIPIGTGLEPENNSTEFGIKIAAKF